MEKKQSLSKIKETLYLAEDLPGRDFLPVEPFHCGAVITPWFPHVAWFLFGSNRPGPFVRAENSTSANRNGIGSRRRAD